MYARLQSEHLVSTPWAPRLSLLKASIGFSILHVKHCNDLADSLSSLASLRASILTATAGASLAVSYACWQGLHCGRRPPAYPFPTLNCSSGFSTPQALQPRVAIAYSLSRIRDLADTKSE